MVTPYDSNVHVLIWEQYTNEIIETDSRLLALARLTKGLAVNLVDLLTTVLLETEVLLFSTNVLVNCLLIVLIYFFNKKSACTIPVLFLTIRRKIDAWRNGAGMRYAYVDHFIRSKQWSRSTSGFTYFAWFNYYVKYSL